MEDVTKFHEELLETPLGNEFDPVREEQVAEAELIAFQAFSAQASQLRAR